MRIAVGFDHAGYPLKGTILAALEEAGHEVVDCGTDSAESVDYPVHAAAPPAGVRRARGPGRARMRLRHRGEHRGQQVPGVRAVNAHDAEEAEMARRHNDANVLALAGRTLDDDEARAIIETFLPSSSRAAPPAPRRSDRGNRERSTPRSRRRPERRQLDGPGPRLLQRAAVGGRSRDRGVAPARARAPAGHARDDRLGELRAARDPRGGGLGAHQQVRRGATRQALLRRLRVGRRLRAARDRPGEGAVRRRARERAAPRRRAGEQRRLHGAARPGRHDPRHGARPRRPPHPRHEAERVGQALQRRRLPGPAGGLPRRHGAGRARSRRSTGRR